MGDCGNENTVEVCCFNFYNFILSNSPDMETGEIVLQLFKQTFEQSNNLPIFVDAKTLLSRKQIDQLKHQSYS